MLAGVEHELLNTRLGERCGNRAGFDKLGARAD
jgi:hypothetical protein